MSLTLTRKSLDETQAPAKFLDGSRKLFVLNVKCTATPGTSPKIFLMQDGQPGFGDGLYYGVAAYRHLKECPEDSPSEGIPFYRVDEVTIVGSDPDALDTTWNRMCEEAQILADAITYAAALVATDTFTTT